MTANDAGLQADALTGVEQALFKFGAGQDTRDAAVIAAAFTDDAILDFTHPASQMGKAAEIMKGRAQIVDTIMAVTEPLITSHTVTNVRIVSGSGAEVEAQALIEAMHVDRKAPARRLLLKNLMTIKAVAVGDEWRIRELRFRNLWREGSPDVLFPAPEGSRSGPAIHGETSVILYRPGPAWKSGKPLADQNLETHGRYLAKLTKDGTILSAGPLPSLEGGLVIVAGPVSSAVAVMENDPAVKDRKFLATITSWVPMMGWKPSPTQTGKSK